MHRLQAARRQHLASERDRHAHRAAVSQIEARFITLSERERQVLQYVASGRSNKQIACALGIAEVTVKLHRGTMMRKMSAATLVDLIRLWDAMVRCSA
jgi:FixJ family two-component response regulator